MKIGHGKRIFGWGKRILLLSIVTLPLVTACAIPVREAHKADTSLSIGSIQGDSFVGQRYPFNIRIPAGWQATTQYPEFLVEQGYCREGLQETPFFLFNPRTKSSLQVEFSPAGRHVRFNQQMIQDLTQSVAGGLVAELRQEEGKDFSIQLSQTMPVQLKGVPYGARRSAQFTIKGEPREQGWIYAFAEPYQIFIFYLITGENRAADKEALEQALSSFEYLGVR